jgi:hypothetical protein
MKMGVAWMAFAHPVEALRDCVARGGGMAGKARRETHHAVVHAAAMAGADRDGGGVMAVVLMSNERGNKVLAHRDTVLNDVHEALAQRVNVVREAPEK